MGATQSARPKVLVYGAPHAGTKSLVKALGDAEFELFTADDGADVAAFVRGAHEADKFDAHHGRLFRCGRLSTRRRQGKAVSCESAVTSTSCSSSA